jgi:hypothetical protein
MDTGFKPNEALLCVTCILCRKESAATPHPSLPPNLPVPSNLSNAANPVLSHFVVLCYTMTIKPKTMSHLRKSASLPSRAAELGDLRLPPLNQPANARLTPLHSHRSTPLCLCPSAPLPLSSPLPLPPKKTPTPIQSNQIRPKQSSINRGASPTSYLPPPTFSLTNPP